MSTLRRALTRSFTHLVRSATTRDAPPTRCITTSSTTTEGMTVATAVAMASMGPIRRTFRKVVAKASPASTVCSASTRSEAAPSSTRDLGRR
eukprot:3346230-Pyramimonas_sp.AAC.1